MSRDKRKEKQKSISDEIENLLKPCATDEINTWAVPLVRYS